jgi:hypothetical protein
MGWQTDEFGVQHEGHVVALVEVEGYRPGSGVYRELGLADDKDRNNDPRMMIAAACECGWRSPRWSPKRGWWSADGLKYHHVSWIPHAVLVDAADEEEAHRLWERHIEQDIRAYGAPFCTTDCRCPPGEGVRKNVGEWKPGRPEHVGARCPRVPR